MARVREVSPVVKFLLEKYPQARDDDRFLIIAVYRRFGADVNKPFWRILSDHTLPNFESIRRSRQKIQQENPELRATDKVEEIRSAEQIEYREFAREKGV